ncbi:MAG: hypothetical protein ACLSHL_09475 [Alistipes communis]
MPDPAIDSVLNSRFDLIIDKVFDRSTGRPYKYEYRIQNVSSTIGMLADRYMAYGNEADLDLGERLAAYLMSCQRADGAYMNGNTDYTSVIYPAKAFLSLPTPSALQDEKNKRLDLKHQLTAPSIVSPPSTVI